MGAGTTRAATTWGQDLVTVGFGLWMVVGVLVDANAHLSDPGLESFFSPWHAILYSGFVSAAAWTVWLVARNLRAGRRGLGAMPVGYGLALGGVAAFGLGGTMDLVWHTLLGIEVGVDALLSPPHLALFAGALLILTTPWRGAWTQAGDPAPGLRAFLPVLLSAAATAATAAFFLSYLSPFVAHFAPTPAAAAELAGGGHEQVEQFWARGVASVLVTNGLLVGILLLLLRRWQTPPGTATALFTLVAAGISSMLDFASPALLLAPLAGGIVTDVLVIARRPVPTSRTSLRLVGALAPIALWTPYYAVLAATEGLALPPEVWSGTIVMASLAGFGLALLAAPPAIPAEDPTPQAASQPGVRAPVPIA